MHYPATQITEAHLMARYGWQTLVSWLGAIWMVHLDQPSATRRSSTSYWSQRIAPSATTYDPRRGIRSSMIKSSPLLDLLSLLRLHGGCLGGASDPVWGVHRSGEGKGA